MAADRTPLIAELARLARVQLAAEDARTFGEQLDTILGYLERLQAVDVEEVPEYAAADQPRSSLRNDVVGPRIEGVLSAAPTDADGRLDVPKFKD